MRAYLAISVILLILIALGIFYRASFSSQVISRISEGQNKNIIIRIPLHSWTFEPDHIEAKAGDRLTITVINADDIEHGFAISEYRERKSIPAFATATLPTFTVGKEGKFQFYCSEICGDGSAENGIHKGDKRGHFDMAGQLTVGSK